MESLADFLPRLDLQSRGAGGRARAEPDGPWAWEAIQKLPFLAKSRAGSPEVLEVPVAILRSTVQEVQEEAAAQTVRAEAEAEALEAERQAAVQQLHEHGFCFRRQGVSAECCESLARYVDAALSAAEADVAAADDEAERYARHRKYFRRLAHATRQDRIELTLPMEPPVVIALKEMVTSVGGILEDFVGRSGRLVDLSCMISDPGCEFQPLHADTSMERVKFTVFVALQEVTQEMGPTFLCPESHNFESHSALDVMKKMPLPHEEMLQRFGAMPALCDRGDIFIMNSQLLHCGGGQAEAAMGGRRRRLLYVTWHLPGITPGEHSLRDELVGQYRLGHFDGGPLPTSWSEDEEEYSRLFVAANKLDDMDAILHFAQLLRQREDQGALVWMRRAARKGHPLACLFLSEMYCLGEPPMDGPDYEKAEELRKYGMALYEHLRSKTEAEDEIEPPVPPDFLSSIG